MIVPFPNLEVASWCCPASVAPSSTSRLRLLIAKWSDSNYNYSSLLLELQHICFRTKSKNYHMYSSQKLHSLHYIDITITTENCIVLTNCKKFPCFLCLARSSMMPVSCLWLEMFLPKKLRCLSNSDLKQRMRQRKKGWPFYRRSKPLQLSWTNPNKENLLSRLSRSPGARFSKLPVIIGPVKLLCSPFQVEVSKVLKIIP